MIYSYGITQQGLYHVRNNLVCQDAHAILKVNDNLCFAAVADGLGSEKYSDVASKIAVETIVEHCKEKITESSWESEILDTLKEGYSLALSKILAEAKRNGHPEDQYDTTLSAVVMLRDRIFYGHSGDSGIVALKSDGEYVCLTKQQRDENGCVFPLCFEDKWVFGTEDWVSSVLLATDGMLETLFPHLLRNESVTIYVALAQFFMDNASLGFGKVPDSDVKAKIEKFVSNISEAQVNDDKTVVCVLNTETRCDRKDDDYYKVPDWAELKRKNDDEFRRLAYPNLYNKQDK